MDASSAGWGDLQNGQLLYIPRRCAAKIQPLHTFFMQQTLIHPCSPTGISMRRKQIGHLSLSGLSWPLVINRRSRFRAAARSADSAEPARTGDTASAMVALAHGRPPPASPASLVLPRNSQRWLDFCCLAWLDPESAAGAPGAASVHATAAARCDVLDGGGHFAGDLRRTSLPLHQSTVLQSGAAWH